MISVGTNALASSIVLALRPRPEDASVIDRRRFTAELRDELPHKLRELQQGSIAPVDLPQAAIGPGMAILSRYAKVVEANGDAMTVRSALQVINQVLGEVLSAQEGDLDSGTRWCVKWFESYGFDPGPYGEAETLASAFNTSVAGLDRSRALSSRAGKVQLFEPVALSEGYDPHADDHITLWEVVIHLAKALDEKGLDAAGLLMARAASRVDLDAAKELAYLLFSIAERKRWSSVAQLFNMLAASWADVLDAARRTPDPAGEQLVLDTAY
jgi:putative DNA methylase